MNTLLASEVIERTARRAVKPRIFEPVWKWAERNVRLSVRTTNTPGQYDSGWIAYTRGWQEAFSNPRVKEIAICAAAQTGKTESILNCIRYAIAEDPGPMMWIMPAESLARSFSETRLQPSLKDCPPCAEQITEDPDAFKLLEMHFKDCTLNLVGANSPAQLSSRPVRYLFADEIDKFPEARAKEAGALELAKVRTTSFWNAKTILTSTPTVESGQIWQAYLNGTRHKYFVRCPHCQHEQELLFPQVRWPKDERTKPGAEWNVDAVERLAYYECPACRHHIEQNWRHAMIRGGCWKATNPNAPADRVSFHLNALYSPWRTWGSIAREFLEVKDSPSGLQNFTNSVLAEAWKPVQGEAVSEAQLLDLRADYPLGTCPAKPHFITLAADVQRDCVYFTVRAWGQDEESWLVDYGKLPTLESLNEIMAREYNIAGTDERMKPIKGMIDSGYNTQAVYEFCSASRGRIHPAKGWEKLAQPVKQATVDFVPGGRGGMARHIALFHFDDCAFKVELYIRRIKDRQGPRWHIPFNIGPDFIQQVTAEKMVERKNYRGVPEQVWHRSHKDNHLGDCEKIQLVQGYLLASELRKPATPPLAPESTAPQGQHNIWQTAPTRGGWVGGWK